MSCKNKEGGTHHCACDCREEYFRGIERQLAEAHKEIEEQARLLGMSGSREAELMAKLAEAKKDHSEWGCTKVIKELEAKLTALWKVAEAAKNVGLNLNIPEQKALSDTLAAIREVGEDRP